MYVSDSSLLGEKLTKEKLSSKADQHDEARKVFSDIAFKYIDWPEAIWEAWTLFEHLYGSVEQLEACLDKIERAQYQTNVRRAKVCCDINGNENTN